MKHYTKTIKNGIAFYKNEGGREIAVTDAPVVEQDGFVFRDLERTGVLLPYEDWRLGSEARAEDLAARLSIPEIAGLMMYSPHQNVPFRCDWPFYATYGGKRFEESGAAPDELTDQQRSFLTQGHIRHVLTMLVQDTASAVRWSNRMQAAAEALPHGIPVNVCSDPRHGAGGGGAEFASAANGVSRWPEGLGLAATFSEETARQYGEAVAAECRALGIATGLFPQVDLGTEPRWLRCEGTMGQNPEQVTRLTRVLCDAMQTTPGEPDGWGKRSICAMAKHWPGGGPCESGRDAHYPFGKFAVYPGGQLAQHMKPFLDGAFRLDGPTKCVSGVMPYYSISWNVDTKNGENVGNAYSRYIVGDLLREKYGFDGVVCTDWEITQDPGGEIDSFTSRCYGAEQLSEAERHLRLIENGVDQFGGNADIAPVLEAYAIGCARHGEAWMQARMRKTAKRLLLNMFRCGLFDNPYLDEEESESIVGCEAYREAGYAAQAKSVVLLKDTGVLPLKKGTKIYVPERQLGARKNFFRGMTPGFTKPGADKSTWSEAFEWVDTPQEADVALVFAESPLTNVGYGEDGYEPITLQYRPYTAETARAVSVAGGDFREADDNRSYRGKAGRCANECDLDNVIAMRREMGEKPVILVERVHNPMVLSEVEPLADALLVSFGVEQRVIRDILCGDISAGGRLPVGMPKNMETIEAHCEDAPFDYEAYTDTEGNTYRYGFGLGAEGTE